MRQLPENQTLADMPGLRVVWPARPEPPGAILMDYGEIVLRLLSAVSIGCVIGIDRILHGKPTGMKTLGLVALGASLMTMASMDFATVHGKYDASAVSRVIQGVITGVGFLGAGVILHEASTTKVHGLTTAATIWVTACLGAACGAGAWRLALTATVIVGLVLLFGGALEKTLRRRLDRHRSEGGDPE